VTLSTNTDRDSLRHSASCRTFSKQDSPTDADIMIASSVGRGVGCSLGSSEDKCVCRYLSRTCLFSLPY